MIDYFIAIACNTFPKVKMQLDAVPYNNENALELINHLTDVYDERKYECYMGDSVIQKITYKLEQTMLDGKSGTVYEYLLDKYLE